MGQRRQMKRLAAPWFYPILRKEYKWVVKPQPGPHSIEASIPLLVLVRDVMGIAETGREARKIISEGLIKVDGVVRKSYKYPVGFMDVIEIVSTGETYRILPDNTKFMRVHRIDKDEAGLKPLRIENKTIVKNGYLQLNLYGGYNVLIKTSSPIKPPEDVYKTLDTVVISLENKNEIKDHIRFGENALALVIGGNNVGRLGRILKVQKGMRRYRTIVTLKDLKGHMFQTTVDKVFVIGYDKPIISLPGEML